MRDIRNDLLERADLAQDQIKDADVHFERMAMRCGIQSVKDPNLIALRESDRNAIAIKNSGIHAANSIFSRLR
jgi:hypothetical protein